VFFDNMILLLRRRIENAQKNKMNSGRNDVELQKITIREWKNSNIVSLITLYYLEKGDIIIKN